LSWASEVFPEHLAQRRCVQQLLSKQLLELAVLLLERLKAFRLDLLPWYSLYCFQLPNGGVISDSDDPQRGLFDVSI
jgi:hypothetical protein